MPACATASRSSASTAAANDSSAPAPYESSRSMPTWKRAAATGDGVVTGSP